MRTSALAALLLLTPITALALTPAEIERIKASAAATAAVARGQGAINADGSLARTSDGKLVNQPANSANTANQLEYVKKLTGVDTVAEGSNPATGGAGGGAVSGKQSVDFQCGRDEGQRKAAGGVSVQLGECYGTSFAAVEALKLSFCTASINGEPCRAELFTAPEVVRAGAYVKVADGLSAGFACNSAGACRVTVLTDYSVQSAGGAAMASQAQGAAAGNTSLAANLRDSSTTISESDLYETVGRSLSECVEAVDSAMEGKSELTVCSKEKKVANPTPDSAASCTTEWVCEQEATQTSTFTRSCVRTFPVTGYRCSWTVPTYECSVTQASTGDPVRTCADGITPNVDELVNSSEKTCSAQAGGESCTWTEYYSSPSRQTVSGDCSSSPLALAGTPTTACSKQGLGDLTACEADGWYRRTLSENECTVSKTDADGTELLYPLTERQKAGCGVCVKPITEDTCDGTPTAAEPADSCEHISQDPSCTLSSTTAESTLPSTRANGTAFVLSQREEYVCQVSETSCVKRREVTNCPASDLTKGIGAGGEEVTPTNSASMNEGLANVATIEALGQAAEECQADSNDPQKACTDVRDVRIFEGEDLRCRKPVGFLSSYSNDCCRISLQREGGDEAFNQCTIKEVELAAARRANLTHYVGTYCAKKSWSGSCKREVQTYCAFPGILAKVVQEQGRVQLAEAVASGVAAPSTASLTFDFYAGSGQWTPAAAAGGALISAWQTPAACGAPGGAPGCPASLAQWFAVCDSPAGAGCSDLPLSPEAGSDTWTIAVVDPLSTVSHATSSRSTVTGGCNTETGRCAYEVSVIPTGSGGQVSVQRGLSFPVSALDPSKADAYPAFLGTTVIKPVVGSAAETPRTLRISRDGGTNWYSVTVPFRISGSMPLGDTGVTISGGCSLTSNNCRYTVAGTVPLTAKPWRSPRAPDCTGFTLDQLSALDFSRMDLSEWIASVMNKLSAPDASKLVGQVATDSQRYYAVYQGSPVPSQSASATVPAKIARVVPDRAMGPFTARMRIGSNYPEVYQDPARNVDPIYSVTVDWGDCTVPQQATIVDEMVDGHRATGFAAEHLYLRTDQVACVDRGEHNLTHTVKITITSKSGVHETTASVLNVWTDY